MPTSAETLAPPVRLSRRRTDGMEGRQARDRLMTTLVLAGTLHGLVILGVSFSPPASRGDGASQGLEVLLVSDELPEARSNDSATYLAQRTQTGSGNTRERLPAQLPSLAQPEAAAASARQSGSADPQLLTTTAASRTRIQISALPDPATAQVSPALQQPAEPQPAADETLRLRGESRDELYVTADTRASRLAPYLDGWRRRVERVGTINYPSAAQRRGLSGNPVIEVALQRDGKLQSARIQTSSGYPEIDAAALAILRLASPFEPFPPELARDYRTLRFAYEWRFEGRGGVAGVVGIP
ncbi:MAG: TonB family protein [Steroidobacteraceae bacterium]